MDVKILGGHLVVSSMVQHQMTQTVSQNGIHGSNTNILYLINTFNPCDVLQQSQTKPDIFEVKKLKINEILNLILYSIEILYIGDRMGV